MKKRVLIIDDETGFTKLLRLNLEQSDEYEVRELGGGKSGVEVAREFKPDVILLDVIMPDLDGRQLAADLAQDPQLKDIPIIYLTGTISRERVAVLGGELDDHPALAKPAHLQEVVGAIEEALKNGAKNPSS